jgi:ribose/xylose/arabinose/galactoside ABC-type transport system permease subunit
LGLRVYALGSNPQAAAMRGVPSDRLRLVLFALVGLAAAMATLFSATQLQVVESGFGAGYELTIIAAVVVGGTSIRGGVGSIWGSVVGALLLGAVSTILIFLKLGDSATYWERAIQGGLILLAVTGDAFLRRGAR